MAHIVILGAGIGGMPAAYEMREILRSGDMLTVISNNPKHHFTPSNPWVAVDWRKRDAIEVDIAPLLAKKNIAFIPVGAKRVHPDKNQIELDDGRSIDYDFLVIATGPKLAFDEVEGLGPKGHTHSVCHVDHAVEAEQAWQEFVKSPGPIVVGAVQMASCYGPAYEFAMIMDTDLRRRKIRDKVPMTFVTAEPYIGHLGLGGVGDSKGMLESELRNADVKWITNAKVTKVEAGRMFVSELDMQGNLLKEHELPFKFSMMLPSFKGVDPVAGVEGLCNPRGFVMVDEYQRSKKYRNIFSAGVCIAIPPVEVTPVPTGAPKTGYMIESMVAAIADNIGADLAGQLATAKGSWNAICLADMGNTGAAFVALPQIPPRNVNWMKKGKWVHYAKIAFEKYFLYKIRSGSSEPIYEKYLLKALGILRLQK